jgi:hypothetical protein
MQVGETYVARAAVDGYDEVLLVAHFPLFGSRLAGRPRRGRFVGVVGNSPHRSSRASSPSFKSAMTALVLEQSSCSATVSIAFEIVSGIFTFMSLVLVTALNSQITQTEVRSHCFSFQILAVVEPAVSRDHRVTLEIDLRQATTFPVSHPYNPPILRQHQPPQIAEEAAPR